MSEEVNLTQNEPPSEQEISEALKEPKSGKTPGKDGLSSELLKVFWRLLKEPFMNMLNAAYQTGALDSDMCRGIINLIPKASKDQCFLKSLRPITLLCTDYKVIEKAISNCLLFSLQHLISQDQKGFLANRKITVNIRKVMDIMLYCEQNNLEGLVLSIDFEKCFDNIETTAILGSQVL